MMKDSKNELRMRCGLRWGKERTNNRFKKCLDSTGQQKMYVFKITYSDLVMTKIAGEEFKLNL